MSNALSVAAVTSTLRALLDQGTRDNPTGTVVTAQPPDKARVSITSNQLNVFLYHTTLDAAWRNMDIPRQVRPNETGLPPLPLNLFYLLTAYGENDDDANGHRVLGRAMSVMHDHPVLSGDDIRASLPADELAEMDLQFQAEGIRITYQPLSLEEMYNLWTTFQAQYRISAAYEVSVVLIDSSRPPRVPLPVLRQGPEDRGPVALPDMTPPFPTLAAVSGPDPRFSPQPGDQVVLSGARLAGDVVEVRFRHRALPAPLVRPPLAGSTSRRITVQIPDGAGAADWAAGIYSVSVTVGTITAGAGVEEHVSNELPLTLAPVIRTITPNPVSLDAAGAATLSLTFEPPFRPGQQAALLIGDQYIPPQEPPAGPQTTLDFVVPGLTAGVGYYPRLRVDGMDTTVINRSASPPRFDDNQKVTVT